jgi:hypothetical protein
LVLCRATIGITVSGKAYAAIAAALPAGSTVADELVPDGEYQVWLPMDVVNRLRALRAPGETFNDVILRHSGVHSRPSCDSACVRG